MHEQQRAGVAVGEQRLNGLHIARGRRVADDVDRVRARPRRGQHGIELRTQAFAEFGEFDAGQRRRIRRHHAGAAAIGHQRQVLVIGAAKARERLGRQEQLLQRVDAQHAGTSDRSIEDHVRSGERAGVRGRRLQALAGAARLHHDHRFVARSGACRRHELAWRFDRLDVKQDGARVRVARQVVEQVAEVDVGVFAERHHVREADLPALRPVEHRGDERTRLRHEGHVAGQCVGVSEARVQPKVRAQQAEAVRAEHAQQARPRGLAHGLLLRRAQAGAHHDRGARAEAGEFVDQADHAARRRADHRQVGHARQVGNAGEDHLPVERGVVRVDGVDRAFERARAQVAPDRRADAAAAIGSADDDDGMRIQQLVEMADAHAARGKNRDREYAGPHPRRLMRVKSPDGPGLSGRAARL